MNRQRNANSDSDIAKRRSSAVKTAWVLAAIAVSIFAAFVFSGVLAE